jgi:hypothetical protein
MPLTMPTIHLNGSSKGMLIEGYTDAHYAIQQALEKLGQTYPNGRDFYPQGAGAIRKAEAEHEARLAKLREVQKELMELVEYIDAQAGR